MSFSMDISNGTGSPAVPFSLPDAEGNMHTLREFSGRWLFMVFHRHLG